jgi:hypothetical protein
MIKINNSIFGILSKESKAMIIIHEIIHIIATKNNKIYYKCENKDKKMQISKIKF